MEVLFTGLERAGFSLYARVKDYSRRVFGHLSDHVFPHARNHYTPHILHHRTLALVSLLAIVLKVGLVAVPTFEPASIAESSAITINSVISLTNDARIQAGIGTVSANALLTKAAQTKAEDMASKGYFAHVSPDGKEPWDFIKAEGYAFSAAGENLAVHFFDVEPLQDAWMNSPGHRANVLNSNFTEMGVGISHGRYENFDTTFVVEMFGKPIQSSQAQELANITLESTVTNEKNGLFAFEPQRAEAEEQSPAVSQPKLDNASNENIPVSLDPEIVDISTSFKGENLEIEVVTNDVVANVSLQAGERGVAFVPLEDKTWKAITKLASLGPGPVVARASNINGESVMKPVAVLSSQDPAVELVGSAESKYKVFGYAIQIGVFERNVGLGMIAVLLTALLVSVLRRWKIHHLKTVANVSFVSIFIALLLVL